MRPDSRRWVSMEGTDMMEVPQEMEGMMEAMELPLEGTEGAVGI